ncbi:hypothetical protein DQ04_01111100 [Trypanosoma grayi]|uniref:hypothetical protein n=1 Tax=Trypanosoma grayi TaxID=71804 RepID=UPI0004F43976|nr:hypothetical protein DQ04_01111100 [Trypanosoma grayi]KEG13273.1 hypothetical protein DQ04_01111100 [Trypanosoma grayi]
MAAAAATPPPPSPAPTTSTATDGAPVTRLPSYFPTTVKQCTAPTDLFFACFEQYAVMQSPTDTTSAKRALLLCQPQLRGYMTCMEKHLAAENTKAWWKFW